MDNNGRICTRCGRRLNTDEHDFDGTKLVGFPGEQPRKATNWVCRVRLIADHMGVDIDTKEPVFRRHYIPKTTQRVGNTNIRYVPIDVVRSWERA